MNTSHQSKAYLFGLGAVLCWSTVATAFKLALEWLSPLQLLLIASLSSWLILAMIILWQGKVTQLRAQLTFKNNLISLLYGALNPALYYWVLLSAYQRLPAQEAQLLNYTWAIAMTLLAIPLLGQRLKRADVIAALLCYGGVWVIATKGHITELSFNNSYGVLLALLSTLMWAFYWILNTRDKRDPVIGLFCNFTAALPLILALCGWQGELAALPWQGILGAVYVGSIEMGISFVLWLQAMKLTQSTAKIANLIFIAPFLSLLLISSVLGEAIQDYTLYGMLLILTGLVIQNQSKT